MSGRAASLHRGLREGSQAIGRVRLGARKGRVARGRGVRSRVSLDGGVCALGRVCRMCTPVSALSGNWLTCGHEVSPSRTGRA